MGTKRVQIDRHQFGAQPIGGLPDDCAIFFAVRPNTVVDVDKNRREAAGIASLDGGDGERA